MKLWIARFKNGELFLFRRKPKREQSWWNEIALVELGSEEFPEVTWENSPLQVEIKICTGKINLCKNWDKYYGCSTSPQMRCEYCPYSRWKYETDVL